MNTSQEDLDTLDHAKFKHHITGGEGCNKDRRKAKHGVPIAFSMSAMLTFPDIDAVMYLTARSASRGAKSPKQGAIL